MPPTALTPVAAVSNYQQTGYTLTQVSIDGTNGNDFVVLASRYLVIVTNPTGGALAFKIHSQPESSTGRKGDVDMNIPANTIKIFPIVYDGWADPANGKVLIEGNASLLVGIVKLS